MAESAAILFRKLDKKILSKLALQCGARVKANMSQSELGDLMAKRFEMTKRLLVEEDVIARFVNSFNKKNADISKGKKRKLSMREQLDSEPAKPGEQVAAKVLKTNENGSWILGNVIDFNGKEYEIQDEDDVSRTTLLSFNEVRRLEETATNLRKGDPVLAVFPETTSFYHAVVVKTPKPPTHANGSWDVVIRFEDDVDESGKTPPRRVPARFVLKRNAQEPDDDGPQSTTES